MREGYETHWLNERLSVGLSAEGLPEYITQRTRWCLGTMQVALLQDGAAPRAEVQSGPAYPLPPWHPELAVQALYRPDADRAADLLVRDLPAFMRHDYLDFLHYGLPCSWRSLGL